MDALAKNRCCKAILSVLGFGQVLLLKLVENILDVFGNRDFDIALLIVPLDRDAGIQFPFFVIGDLVIISDS